MENIIDFVGIRRAIELNKDEDRCRDRHGYDTCVQCSIFGKCNVHKDMINFALSNRAAAIRRARNLRRDYK